MDLVEAMTVAAIAIGASVGAVLWFLAVLILLARMDDSRTGKQKVVNIGLLLGLLYISMVGLIVGIGAVS